LPDSIGNLQNLTSLDLSDNNLKSLPDSIGELQNLTSLSLSENDLKWLPESIKKLAPTLRELNLRYNPISNNKSARKKIKSWLPNTKIDW
jgi:Leucine-rich repeat (LRR) protein